MKKNNTDFIEILYEDNHLIAVNKKIGDIVQGDKTGDKPLGDYIKDYLKYKYKKPGAVFLGVIHRLDRPTTGVVIFARTSKALRRMNKLFQNKEIKKTYWAIVKKCPPKEEGVLKNFLKKNKNKNKSFVVKKENDTTLFAQLKYKLKRKLTSFYQLEIYPSTGRHHQIRTQLAYIGCPIKGDIKYGFKRSNINGGIHLHAKKISFIHPVKKTTLEITAPTPKDSIWDNCS